MTFKYRILKRLVRMIGMKKQSEKDVSEILAMKKKANAKCHVPDIREKDIRGEKLEVLGFPVLKLSPKEAKGAVLFIIGGGMVSPPRPDSIKKAVRVARESGMDLYVPYYPLCTDYPVSKAYEMVYATYERMLEDYPAEKITVLGTSSGGNLALGLIPYMNEAKSALSRPGHILGISPGTCPVSEEERRRMEELDKLDVAIAAKYMFSVEEIMRHGQEVPDYMLHLQRADFTGCPRTTFIYGSDEVLYAVAPSFEEAMQRYGVSYRMIVGEGMFHCYPVFPLCKEAKEGWKMMIRLLQNPMA